MAIIAEHAIDALRRGHERRGFGLGEQVDLDTLKMGFEGARHRLDQDDIPEGRQAYEQNPAHTWELADCTPKSQC